MNLPKALQTLLDMILRDRNDPKPVPFELLKENPQDYLNALARQGDEKYHSKRQEAITAAMSESGFKDFIVILQKALGTLTQEEFPFFNLAIMLDDAFPDGKGISDDSCVRILLDLKHHMGNLTPVFSCGAAPALLFADLGEFCQKNAQGVLRNPDYFCSMLWKQCISEIILIGGGNTTTTTMDSNTTTTTTSSSSDKVVVGVQEKGWTQLIQYCLNKTSQLGISHKNTTLTPADIFAGIEEYVRGNQKISALWTMFLDGAFSLSTNSRKELEAEQKREMSLAREQSREPRELRPPLGRDITVHLDIRYVCESVNHLILGNVHFFDPVIADSACELRPPFILEAYYIVQNSIEKIGKEMCISLVKGHLQNHLSDQWEERYLKECKQVIGQAPDVIEYYVMVRKVLRELYVVKNYYADFLYLCKVMTRCRYVTRDEFGVEIDDGERDLIFLTSVDREKRGQLSVHTTTYNKEIALKVAEDGFLKGGQLKSVHTVLNKCTAGVTQKKSVVKVSPIYSSQKAALAKCCVEGWPILLRISRIKVEGDVCKFLGTAVLCYEPNQDRTGYEFKGCVILSNSDWRESYKSTLLDKPSVCVSAFSICSKEDPLGNEDYFRTEDFGQYVAALQKCDVVHIASLCAANHPPFPDEAWYENNEQKIVPIKVTPQDGALKQHEYEWITLYGQQGWPGFGDTNTSLSLVSPYNFTGNEIHVEHLDMFKLANLYQLHNRRYKTGGLRQDKEVHIYSVHIYVTTLAVELDRAQRAWNRSRDREISRKLDVEALKEEFEKDAVEELKKYLTQ